MKNQDKTSGELWRQDPAQQITDPEVRAIVDRPVSDTDPNGSYTGRPADPSEMPQQDADDL